MFVQRGNRSWGTGAIALTFPPVLSRPLRTGLWMNIVFLALDVDLSIDGGETIHVRELVRFLAKRGNHVELVTATTSEPKGLGEGVVHHVRPGTSDVKAVAQCRRLVRSSQAEAIYDRRLSPKISFAASRFTRVPFTVEVNGIEEEAEMFDRRSAPSLPRIRRWIRGIMFRRAARIVAVSDRLATTFRDRYRVEARRVVAVPNGVDTDAFTPMVRDTALSNTGLPPGEWIVFVGDLVPWQGLETLLRSLPSVFEVRSAARAALVGDGASRESLERISRDLGLTDRVRFVGRVPHRAVPSYVGAASVCVAPFGRARNEKIGLSPLKVNEYLACGRAIVASAIPGVTELVENSGGGIAVPPDDPQALGQAIVAVLKDPEEAARMGERGRRYAVDRCSWAWTAARVEQVLRDSVAVA